MDLQIWKRDPLAKFLIGSLRLSPSKGVLVGCSIYSILLYGAGVLISIYYTGPNIGRIYENPETFVSPVVLILFPAFLWWFYLWQPRGISKALESALKSREENHSELSLPPITTYDATDLFNRPIWSSAAAILSIGVIIGWHRMVVLPDILTHGYAAWWYVFPLYQYAIFLPMVILAIYMLIMIIFRHFLVVATLAKFFSQHDIKVYPLHADNAGGLAEIGNIALTTAYFSVGMGFWAATYSLLGILAYTPQTIAVILSCWILYIVLTPTALIGSAWATHNAMKKSKARQLGKICKDIDRCLNPGQANAKQDIQHYNKQLQALIERHQFIQEHYPEWPFSIPGLRSFSVTAALPLLSPVLTFLKDRLIP